MAEMNTEQEERLEQILTDYASFLATSQPNIADANLLPYPKRVIHATLKWKEQALCDEANKCVQENNKNDLPRIEKYLHSVQEVTAALISYFQIDPDDQERVDYFNRYKALDRIPDHELMECFGYRVNYSKRGWSESWLE